MEEKVYTLKISVEDQQIDSLGHVNNEVYLSWVNQLAKEHWQKLAPENIRKQYRWVVRRQELEYFKEVFPKEKLLAKTWVEEMHGAHSLRRVQISRNGDLVLDARTKWILIDAQNGQVCRITEPLTRMFMP